MKRYLLVLALMSQAPQVGFAQVESEDVNFDLDTPTSTEQVMDGPEVGVGVVEAAPAPRSRKSSRGGQSVTIVNTPTASAQTQASLVQKQPETLIEASPLSESRAEKMRRARQDTELNTELQIVESLEQSRMEDEKRRAQVLFGDKFNNLNNSQQAMPQPQVIVAPPVQVVEVEEKNDVNIREEIKAAMSDMDAEKAADDKKSQDKTYMTTAIGIGSYPDAVNVRGNLGFGLGVGMQSDKMLFEGTFSYNEFDVEKIPCVSPCGPQPAGYGPAPGPYGGYPYANQYAQITSMQQYAGAFGVKYQILQGKLRPNVGTVASYTYRKFTDNAYGDYGNEASSQALDWGLSLGADVQATESFAIGIDFRYMFNLWNRVDSQFQQSFVRPALQVGTPIEEMNYYLIGLSGRYLF
ncbi:MAG: hypothetical protein AB7H97_04855 [Pseudobdellovibrionaceae bacterium]